MTKSLVVVQQYLSWNGHYKQYFENLQDAKYNYLYASNIKEDYINSEWIKSDFDPEKPLTIEVKIKGRFLDSYQIFKKLSYSGFKIIHIIEFEPLTYLLFANRINKNSRLIITIHSSDKLHFSSWVNRKLSSAQRWILEIALQKAVKAGANIVTHYECHKESIIDTIGKGFNDRVQVIHYPAPEPTSKNTKILSDQKSPKFLIYGQIREDKGIYDFLKNESTKALKITVAGKIVDKRIFEFRERENLTIIDKFLSDSEISELVSTNDYMLLPYPLYYTNGAGTFKDSLAKAMPVICSNIAIFKEIVDSYKVGVIFEKPEQILNAVGAISPEKYEVMSRNCLNYAEIFTWKYMKESYFSLYDKLIRTAD